MPIIQLCSIHGIPKLRDIQEHFRSELDKRTELRKNYKPGVFSRKPWNLRIQQEYKTIKKSHLFDVGYYLSKYPEVIRSGVDPIVHYLEHGCKGDFNPHPLFANKWYLQNNPDVAKDSLNPLLHFIMFGARERHRSPHPLFNSNYYLNLNQDVDKKKLNPLVHYILHGGNEGRRTHLLFNSSKYLDTFPDIKDSGITPLEHYCLFGHLTNFSSHRLFDPAYYLAHNPDVHEANVNPLVHYLMYGLADKWRDPCLEFSNEAYVNEHPELKCNPLEHYLNHLTVNDGELCSQEEVVLNETIQFHTRTAPPPLQDKLLFFENEQIVDIPETDVKVLAFYFPQFHPFVENDTFWGKGFTEWTNVTKTQPLFDGHLQPRLPGELGYYDTRIKDVLKRQIELAKTHGVHGICFHHYWFMGRRVMRVPYNMMLENPDLDIPFCLHWANEPWTVRWDGFGNKGVLLDQKHTPDDDLAFIKDIEPALRDKRYIRVDGKPLLIIYRPSLFPNIRESIKRWNSYCESVGIGKLYLAVMQTCFEGDMNPTSYGFDAAIEYPPHNMGIQNINSSIDFFDRSFSGNVLSYHELVDKNVKRKKPPYTLFRGLLPGWDCTPRRKNPDLIVKQSPWKYQEWLESHIEYTKKNLPPAEQFVFVNAWNEWAEGAYLDPDRHFGYAYLNATTRALTAKVQKPKVAIVLHIYFTELLDEFIGYFKNIPFSYDLYVSTSTEQMKAVEEKLFKYIGDKNVHVLAFPNKGRDMGPFVVGYKDIFAKYDLACFVHSKKSTYGKGLEQWRTYLLDNLLGSSNAIQQIVDYFQKNEHLGIVCPDTFPPVSSMVEWGSNHFHVEKLAGKLGIDIDFNKPPLFPSGSMFWFRPKALKPIFDLGITYSDFEEGSEKKNDGTLAHAFERLFFNVAESAGYVWQKVLFSPDEKDKGDIFTPTFNQDLQRCLDTSAPKIAVILHLYYEDLATEISGYLNNIPVKFDLFISVQKDADQKRIKGIFSTCNNVEVIQVHPMENRGRDILPFSVQYNAIHTHGYDLICKVHSKKSSFNNGHSNWRNYLFDNLLGSSQIIKTILYYFMTDSSLGILYPQTYYGVRAYNDEDPFRDNWDNCQKLAQRLGIPISRNMALDFPSGSMFWFRPSALKPLCDLNVSRDEFEIEKGQLDATFAHTFERMFGLISQKAGFSIRKVYFREETSNSASNPE